MLALKAPRPLKPYARALRFGWKSFVRLFGARHPRSCTVCGHHGRFFSYGYPLVADVLCPGCLSLERHRLLALYLSENKVFAGKDVLHFAPEEGMTRIVKQQGPSKYTTCDLFASNVDLKINIEQIALPDESFDRVLCLHVLEHVDDRKAMAEIHRILKPGGVAIVMVPIEEGWDTTYENPAITAPAERLYHFGQEDHVRYFGRDLRDRLKAAGFSLNEYTAHEPYVLNHGLKRGEKVFVCTKSG